MNKHISRSRLLIPGVLFGVLSLLIGLGIPFLALPTAPAVAQSDQEQPRTIQVSGQGQVSAEPDQAVVVLGVQTEEDTAQDALDANNEQMTAVISATMEAGIAETDIQTQGFRLQPIYANSNAAQTPELTGYRAHNGVQITVHDLTQLGELLDTAVSAGSNTMTGIQFEISDQTALEAAAREAAMADAQQKAEQLTNLAGAQLGPVQTILETGGISPVSFSLTTEGSTSASVPIQPGTQSISASVQVTWEIR